MNCSEGCDSSEAWDREYQTSVELGEALREVETLRARADAAEKRARDAEEKLERAGICSAHQDPCHQCCVSAEAKTIAAVIAWLEKRAYDGNEHEIALMVDAIARGEWRPKGREGGE